MYTSPAAPLILLVEDEALIAMLIEDAFIEAGYEVMVASDGPSALACISAAHHRLRGLVTDIRMPGAVDGWGLAQSARELKPELPVVYITGDSMADHKKRGVQGSRLISKPKPPEAIVTAMAELLDAPERHLH